MNVPIGGVIPSDYTPSDIDVRFFAVLMCIAYTVMSVGTIIASIVMLATNMCESAIDLSYVAIVCAVAALCSYILHVRKTPTGADVQN